MKIQMTIATHFSLTPITKMKLRKFFNFSNRLMWFCNKLKLNTYYGKIESQ